MSDSPLIDSLAAAVEARPDDLPLRLHLAELLVGAGRGAEAVGHAAQVLAREPANETARQLMTRALGGPSSDPVPDGSPGRPPASGGGGDAYRKSDVDWAAMEQDL